MSRAPGTPTPLAATGTLPERTENSTQATRRFLVQRRGQDCHLGPRRRPRRATRRRPGARGLSKVEEPASRELACCSVADRRSPPQVSKPRGALFLAFPLPARKNACMRSKYSRIRGASPLFWGWGGVLVRLAFYKERSYKIQYMALSPSRRRSAEAQGKG